MSPRRAFALAALLAVAAGCGEPVEPASRLERPRVLGAVTSLPSDPANAAPGADDPIRVAIFTASRDAESGAFASHALRVCPSDMGTTDYVCGGPELPFREDGHDPVITVEPVHASGELAVFGVMCATGTATFDRAARAFRGTCDDGSHPAELVVRVRVGGPPNKNPVVPNDAVKLDGAALGPSARSGCEGAAPVHVRADGQKHALALAVPASSVEPGDSFVLSHLATHGKLDRLYSTLDDANAASVDWEAPGELSAPRETARFHVVFRDGRGGVATTVASICLER